MTLAFRELDEEVLFLFEVLRAILLKFDRLVYFELYSSDSLKVTVGVASSSSPFATSSKAVGGFVWSNLYFLIF